MENSNYYECVHYRPSSYMSTAVCNLFNKYAHSHVCASCTSFKRKHKPRKSKNNG